MERPEFLRQCPYNKAQRDLKRGGVGHTTLLALFDVVLGFLEFVADKFKVPRSEKS